MKDMILWIDTETSGLDSEKHALLEIGAVITDRKGQKIGSSFHAIIQQKDLSKVIKESDERSLEIHEKNGLWLDLWGSQTTPLRDVDLLILEWINQTVNKDQGLCLGGNSPYLDRDFIRANLPNLYKRMSYRTIDVTSIALLLQGIRNEPWFIKMHLHRALPDILESIEEYKHYIKRIEGNK